MHIPAENRSGQHFLSSGILVLRNPCHFERMDRSVSPHTTNLGTSSRFHSCRLDRIGNIANVLFFPCHLHFFISSLCSLQHMAMCLYCKQCLLIPNQGTVLLYSSCMSICLSVQRQSQSSFSFWDWKVSGLLLQFQLSFILDSAICGDQTQLIKGERSTWLYYRAPRTIQFPSSVQVFFLIRIHEETIT